MKEKSESHKVTIGSITVGLERARQLAITDRNPMAAINASMAKAKLHGLIRDKVAIAQPTSIDGISDSEIDALIDQKGLILKTNIA